MLKKHYATTHNVSRIDDIIDGYSEPQNISCLSEIFSFLKKYLPVSPILALHSMLMFS